MNNGLPQGYPKQVSAAEFLRSFGLDVGNASWLTQSYGTGSRPSLEAGGFAHEMLPKLRDISGQYYSQALIRQGSLRRANETFESAWVFVLDDIGLPGGLTGAMLDQSLIGAPFGPEPSYMVETSQANFQGSFVIFPRETNVDKWRCFKATMGAHPVWGKGLINGKDITHLYRLPTGTNPKNGFRTRLYRPFTGLTYTLDELADAFGVDISPAAVAVFLTKLPSPNTYEQISIPHLRGIMEHITNNERFSRESWVGIAHAMKSCTCEDPEGGKEIFVWWTSTWVDAKGRKQKQVPGEAETVWDTLDDDHHADLGHLRRLAEEEHPGSYQARAAVVGPDAQFTAVEPEDARLAQEAKDTEDLLLKLRRCRAVDPAFDTINNRGDLKNGLGSVVSARTRKPGPHAMRPELMGGLLRGQATLWTGPAGSGKSTLALGFGIAIAYGDPAIVGVPKIDFPGEIVFIGNEDPAEEVFRRMDALEIARGLQLSAIRHDIYPVSSRLIRRAPDGTYHLTCVDLLKFLIELRTKQDIALIVIDTLTSIMEAVNHNDSSEMPKVMDLIQRIAWASWASVVVLHHPSKAAAQDDTLKRSLSAARGSGTIGDTVRSAYTVTAPTLAECDEFGWTDLQARDIVVLDHAKGSWTKSPEKIFYRKDSRDIPTYDPRNLTAVVSDSAGLLTPFTPAAPVSTPVSRTAHVAVLRKAAAAGSPLKWNADGRRTGKGTVQQALGGLQNREAERIVNDLIFHKLARVDKRKIGSNMFDVLVILEVSEDGI